MRRLLIPSTALLWGLQLAFLNPALALILTALYDASTTELGWALALYNASGLIATAIIPSRADRSHRYLPPMLASAGLTFLLAVLLGVVGSLPVAVAALIVLGGPAGVGSSLLFAHLRHSGASSRQIVNTRALFSVSWVAGPPLATLIIGAAGERAVLGAVALIAVLCILAGTAVQRTAAADATASSSAEAEAEAESESTTSASAQASSAPEPAEASDGEPAAGRGRVAAVVGAFVLLQAANASAMSFLTVYVAQTLGLDVVWAGIALGVAAGLEVPAMWILGWLGERHSPWRLLLVAGVVGVVYYALLAAVSGPVGLIAIQVLNAWSFATVSGIGLTLFQQIIDQPGRATGLYMNSRRVGAILSGGAIGAGSATVLGQSGIFVLCAILTAGGALVLAFARPRRRPPRPASPSAAPDEDRRTIPG